jgi:hypothetical protein
VQLCKSSHATGSFAFTWSLDGVSQGAIPGGPIVIVDPLLPPVCRNIYVSARPNADDLINNVPGYQVVVITEAADQSSNWTLIGRDVDQYIGQFVTYPSPRLDDEDDTGLRSITVYINRDMAKRATFTNLLTESPTSGCTYTKGWYQNRNGSPTVLDGIDGRSKANAQAIFAATPGKPNGVTWQGGNNTLNLYQQLLAALNNLGGDTPLIIANAPAAVQTAINAALAATGGTLKNITLAAGTNVGALTGVLSSFNEGQFPTWPHCRD